VAKEAEAKEGEAEAKKGGPMKLLLIIVPIVLLLVGGVVAFFVLKGGSSSSASPTATKTVKHTPGTVVTAAPITINLAGGHYLSLGLALQPEKTATEVEPSKAEDLAIEVFSGMTVADLSTTKGRNEAKAELVKRVSEVYEKGVYDIYFTSFVMS
jgi:flagellar FliL protein